MMAVIVSCQFPYKPEQFVLPEYGRYLPTDFQAGDTIVSFSIP